MAAPIRILPGVCMVAETGEPDHVDDKGEEYAEGVTNEESHERRSQPPVERDTTDLKDDRFGRPRQKQ